MLQVLFKCETLDLLVVCRPKVEPLCFCLTVSAWMNSTVSISYPSPFCLATVRTHLKVLTATLRRFWETRNVGRTQGRCRNRSALHSQRAERHCL